MTRRLFGRQRLGARNPRWCSGLQLGSGWRTVRRLPRCLSYRRVHPPEKLKTFTTEHFIVRVEGRSTEPRIRSGSHCLMRLSVPGTRSGRTVLVEERKVAECAYTLKLYFRDPKRTGLVILRSENPEQPDIDINEDAESQDQRYAVMAEFVQVIEGSLKWLEFP
jgi:phage repressor protein C with HTH and peptisase S24 domain